MKAFMLKEKSVNHQKTILLEEEEKKEMTPQFALQTKIILSKDIGNKGPKNV